MPKQKDFDYKKAAADLEDVGAYEPDEIYRRKTKKSIDSYLRENDLNPKKYYKSNNKTVVPVLPAAAILHQLVWKQRGCRMIA